MKTNKIYLMMFLGLIAIIGCSEDDDAMSSDELIVSEIIGVSTVYQILPCDYKKSKDFTFTYADDWVITGLDDDSRFSVTPKSGKAGDNTITISANDYNCTSSLHVADFSITPVNKTDIEDIVVHIEQPPVFDLNNWEVQANPNGDTLHWKIKTDMKINESIGLLGDFHLEYEMMEKSTIDGKEIEIVIKPNKTDKIRYGSFSVFMTDNDGRLIHSGFCCIEQPTESSISKDMYTEDGKVTRLLSHTKGKGIPIVIMGDGFLDVDITSGKYRSVTKKAADAIFGRYPMSCLKEYFDVYEVTAVSRNNYISGMSSTAFSCSYGDRRSIYGNDSKIVEYANKAIDEERMENAVILTLLNDTSIYGSCTMYPKYEISDIPSGLSIAYFPIGGDDFDCLVNHEVVGHGFAKLDDEYTEFDGVIPSSEVDYIKRFQSYGIYRNDAFNDDVTKSYWAKLAADARYASEKLGCYEGGSCYPKGVWRSTDDSVMNGFVEYFNPIGRLMIYKRCMSIAYGNKWKFNYEDFVDFERANAPAYASSSKAKTRSTSKHHLTSCVRIVEDKGYK